MCRRMFTQVHKLHCHFLAYDVVTMTEVLETLDPDDTSSFNCPDEHPKPHVLCGFEEVQWRQQHDWRKDKEQLQQSQHCLHTFLKPVEHAGSLDLSLLDLHQCHLLLAEGIDPWQHSMQHYTPTCEQMFGLPKYVCGRKYSTLSQKMR